MHLETEDEAANRALRMLAEVQPPAGMEARVLQRLRRAEGELPERGWWWNPRWLSVSVPAVCALAVLVAFVQVSKRGDTSSHVARRLPAAEGAQVARAGGAATERSLPDGSNAGRVDRAKVRLRGEGAGRHLAVDVAVGSLALAKAGAAPADAAMQGESDEGADGRAMAGIPDEPLPPLQGVAAPGRALPALQHSTPGDPLPKFRDADTPGHPLPTFDVAAAPGERLPAFAQATRSGDQP